MCSKCEKKHFFCYHMVHWTFVVRLQCRWSTKGVKNYRWRRCVLEVPSRRKSDDHTTGVKTNVLLFHACAWNFRDHVSSCLSVGTVMEQRFNTCEHLQFCLRFSWRVWNTVKIRWRKGEHNFLKYFNMPLTSKERLLVCLMFLFTRSALNHKIKIMSLLTFMYRLARLSPDEKREHFF